MSKQRLRGAAGRPTDGRRLGDLSIESGLALSTGPTSISHGSGGAAVRPSRKKRLRRTPTWRAKCRISGSGRPSRFEHWGARGDHTSSLPCLTAVLRIMRAEGFGDIQVIPDTRQVPRVVFGTVMNEVECPDFRTVF